MQNVPKSIKDLASKAIKNVKAYGSWLKTHDSKIKTISTDSDFYSLPITNKKDYIGKFKVSELTLNKQVPQFTYASSGSSGVPTFWFRDESQEKIGIDIHETIFRDIFKIKKEQKVLVVITFSMGIWIAGNYTAAAIAGLSTRGYNVTVATPGLERNDILNVFKNIAPNYDTIVICGYPPFLMDVILDLKKNGIDFKKHNMFGLTAGDKFTEQWRDLFMKIVKKENNPACVVGVYGSADAVVMGFETPLSILLRRTAIKDRELYKELFGDEKLLPNISQYDENFIFFEEKDTELVITAPTSIPLIRYNIHDRGNIIRQADMKKIIENSNLPKKSEISKLFGWDFPFVIVKGRTDVATTFYALNIYPENIRAAVEDKKIKSFLSGNFLVYNKQSADAKRESLFVELEMNSGISANKALTAKATNIVVKHLMALNIEFAKLHKSIGKMALPKVLLINYQKKDFSKSLIPSLVNIKGKKPRMLLGTK
ncbi:MAG: hypothetical protein EXS49_01165 [Candidatus Pacebacteria bacterium]|nr:hypothetical protein [Candidatus Paceibacterota bacterium]